MDIYIIHTTWDFILCSISLRVFSIHLYFVYIFTINSLFSVDLTMCHVIFGFTWSTCTNCSTNLHIGLLFNFQLRFLFQFCFHLRATAEKHETWNPSLATKLPNERRSDAWRAQNMKFNKHGRYKATNQSRPEQSSYCNLIKANGKRFDRTKLSKQTRSAYKHIVCMYVCMSHLRTELYLYFMVYFCWNLHVNNKGFLPQSHNPEIGGLAMMIEGRKNK